MLQEQSDGSRRLHKKRKIVKNVLIKPKLSSHSVGRIMHKLKALVSQIRQPPSIGGCQVSDPCLLEISQGGGGSGGVNKETHNGVCTCVTRTQIPISSPRKPNSFIKRLNSRMINWLQTRLAKSQ